MASYDSYKDSGVKWLGQIPSHWQIEKLRHYFDEITELNSNRQSSNQLQFKFGTIIPKSDQSVDDTVWATICKYIIVKPDDIIINGLNLNYDLISHRIGRVREHGVITSAYVHIRPHSNVSSKYYEYLFKAMDAKKVFHGFGTGVRATLSYKELKHKPIAIPPIDEQVAIVAYLDNVTAEIDRAIDLQQKMIDALNERIQIIIYQAVTKGLNPDAPLRDSGIDWLGQIPAHWKCLQIRRILRNITTGKTPPGADERYFAENGIPWVTPGDFTSNLILEKGNKFLSKKGEECLEIYPVNSVLIVGIGTIGKVMFAPMQTTSNQQINSMTFSGLMEPMFATYYLSVVRTHILNTAKFTTLPIFNQSENKRVFITVPPIIEQKAIIQYINSATSNINEQLANCQRMIDLLTERKQIIINQVVTGKVKVI